ncbi:aldehyde ferredoxin oxidoreductase family protein [Hyperthermus butylicus]|uniref:Aldehyde:ferredoxin oxidoreductase n=1 Tax=Hyperthermus butylicus (strain DSM 5456 / JCM 9403 / PLM1-5) TaxID=415426 RepID=A2BN13_HYPBU|nr:aldehyde ferredoxin oxidoreductase family protein [Hyperthermus butylicus]ABM81374.1 Aldehyde:ferredoxin oxidoreductase [Hyperthermus butylicus DSM 5456]
MRARSLYGWTGRLARVDLSRGTCHVEQLNSRLLETYIGGRGLAARLFLDYAPGTGDPLSPGNVVVAAVGPVTGTAIPMNSRVHFVFKSPLTGGYGESSMGGSWPSFFKWAGYDALVILGASEKPAYIVLEREGCRVEDASQLWGLDAYDAEEELVKMYGVSTARAIVIGPAGENLVRYAVVTHGSPRLGIGRGGQAGRTGLGAVFGSKKLKAVIAIAEEKSVPVADEEGVKDLARSLVKKLSEKGIVLRRYGTMAMLDIGNALGFLPTGYWTRTRFEGLTAEKINSEVVRGRLACISCPIACGRDARYRLNGRSGRVEGLEYETTYALGSLLELDEPNAIAYLNDLADKLGIDTISLGNVLGLALAAREKLGLDIPSGKPDVEVLAKLVEDIAYRRGVGKILAEGVKAIAEKLGLEELAVHVRGLEPPGYDPRGLWGMYIAYATSPRGACHLRHMAYIIDIRGLAGDSRSLSKEKIMAIVEWEDRMSLFDSITMCKFSRDVVHFEEASQALAVVTGLDYNVKLVREKARLITLLAHYIERNVFGRAASYDRIPARLLEQSADGKAPAPRQLVEEMLAEYYRARGLDAEGRVKLEELRRLGADI